jgi:RNA polymerase sigma factor (sigma-70 family)
MELPMNDLQSLAASVRTAQDEFIAAIEPHRAAFWRYCYRLTGSVWDAEDLAQESLARAFGRLSRVWQPTQPRAYLFRIASNTWIDATRRAGDAPRDADAPTAAEIDHDESAAALQHLAATLPRTQAVVVLLVDVFDFRVDEAAEMLNLGPTAVKGVLERARASLRRRRTESEAGPIARLSNSTDKLVAQYIDAFNRRDIDALAALLHDDGVVDVVAVGENRGRAFTRGDSLAQWAVDPLPQRAEAGEFGGEQVVFVFAPADGVEQLHRIDRHTWTDGRIRLWRTYFYTPEVLALAGAALGMPAARHTFLLSAIT